MMSLLHTVGMIADPELVDMDRTICPSDPYRSTVARSAAFCRAITPATTSWSANRCPGASAAGRPVPPATAGEMWRAVRGKAGCDGMHLHHLRHYYASGLIAAGCDVVTVQRALGHGSATITLDTYAHLWPTAEDKTRAAAASMIAETLDAADSVRTTG